MSRVGRIPIKVPQGVDVHVDGNTVRVKGPKGELSQELKEGITASFEDGQLSLARSRNSQTARAHHGLYRALLRNMVEGVEKGYERRLEIVGVS